MPGLPRPFAYELDFLLRTGVVAPVHTLPQPPSCNPYQVITQLRFGLVRFRSPLLTESHLFSLPVGTEMFHFPTFPPHALCVQARVTPHDWCGVPPFGNPRINARLTAPRGLSQPPTSFIGSWCPGIHRVPLTTWPHKNPTHHTRKDALCGPTRTLEKAKSQKMLASTVQFSTYDQTPTTQPRQPRTPHEGPVVRDQAGPDMSQQPSPTNQGARSLRTQQRAYEPTTHHHPDPHAPKDAVLGAAAAAGRTGQRSTLEHHPTRCAGTRRWAPIMV